MKNRSDCIAINRRSPELWKEDTACSVALYNNWFLEFAPSAYVGERQKSIESVRTVIAQTDGLHLSVMHLMQHPEMITVLRMSTTPTIARDRLIGLAGIKPAFIKSMENGRFPRKMTDADIFDSLSRILDVLDKLIDKELFSWLKGSGERNEYDRIVAESVVADRLCGAMSDPIIRNEQEKRQFRVISNYLEAQGYVLVDSKDVSSIESMQPGTFAFHLNVPVRMSRMQVNMPIDVVIQRKDMINNSFPLLVECKSAGDFANTNKRRKEEAQKMEQLQSTYGKDVDFVLFLCGYFDSAYLGYEAAEGIDWIWEHRIGDFKKAGV